MQLPESTFTYQSKLAAFCRTGELDSIPGIRQENISHYRRLVYNVVDDMLQSAYPLTNELLTDEEWDNMVTSFFRDHPCQSPQVWNMPKELIVYLDNGLHPLTVKYPFLLELLHFEWIEVDLFMMADKTVPAKDNGNILIDKLVINPEHCLLTLTFPVHQKRAADINNSDTGHYFVAAHRNKEGEVLFTSLSPALSRLLEYLEDAPASVPETLYRFETEYNLVLTEADQQSIQQFFQDAKLTHLISGYAI